MFVRDQGYLVIVNDKCLFVFISIFILTAFCNSTNVDAKEKKAWNISYKGTLAYDDNVDLKSDDEVSHQGSIVGRNQISGRYKTTVNGGDLKASASYVRSDYGEKDIDDKFNLQTIAVGLRYKHPSPIGKIGLGVGYNRSFLVGKDYRQLLKFGLSDQIKFKQGFSIISFKIGKPMYYKNEGNSSTDRDAMRYTLGGSYRHYLFNKKGYVKGGISGRTVDTDGSDYDLKQLSLTATLKVPLDFGFILTAKGRAEFDRYNNKRNQTEPKRKDNDYRFSFDLQRKLGKYFKAGLKYLHKNEKSNIPSFEYDKNVYSFFIKGTF